MPGIGAIGKALIAGTAKKYAKKAAKNITSAAKLLKSDESITKRTLQNARRRYERRAKRLMQKLDSSTGLEKERIKRQIEANLKRSFALFADKKARERFADKWNLTDRAEADMSAVQRYYDESERALESILNDPRKRREIETEELLRSDVGRLIYSSTRDIWFDPTKTVQDPSTFNQKIMDAFGVDSMAEVIDQFERELGEDLYKPEGVENVPVSGTPTGTDATKFARQILFNSYAR